MQHDRLPQGRKKLHLPPLPCIPAVVPHEKQPLATMQTAVCVFGGSSESASRIRPNCRPMPDAPESRQAQCRTPPNRWQTRRSPPTDAASVRATKHKGRFRMETPFVFQEPRRNPKVRPLRPLNLQFCVCYFFSAKNSFTWSFGMTPSLNM